jgi:2'-5' RNA ligase
MARLRLGVAILVPPPVALEVDGMRRGLGDPSLGRVGPHLTLVPPINVRADQMGQAHEVLRRAAASARPFHMGLGPPDTFHPDSPVVYLPLADGGDEVRRLRETVFVPPLARELSWPFVPHVTLADELDPSRIPAALAALASFRAEVVVDSVHLLAEGPSRHWQPSADFPLSRPAVVGRGGLPLELSVVEAADLEVLAWARDVWAAHDQTHQAGVGWPETKAFAVVARRGHRIVGLVEGRFRGNDCDLDRMIVDPASRGEGVGTSMLASVESTAAERGCSRCRLEAPRGGRAQRFYEGRGWRVSSVLADWRGGVDYVRMERVLDPVSRTR